MDLLQQGQKLGICFQKEDKIVEMYCTISKVFDDRINIELQERCKKERTKKIIYGSVAGAFLVATVASIVSISVMRK